MMKEAVSHEKDEGADIIGKRPENSENTYTKKEYIVQKPVPHVLSEFGKPEITDALRC